MSVYNSLRAVNPGVGKEAGVDGLAAIQVQDLTDIAGAVSSASRVLCFCHDLLLLVCSSSTYSAANDRVVEFGGRDGGCERRRRGGGIRTGFIATSAPSVRASLQKNEERGSSSCHRMAHIHHSTRSLLPQVTSPRVMPFRRCSNPVMTPLPMLALQ